MSSVSVCSVIFCPHILSMYHWTSCFFFLSLFFHVVARMIPGFLFSFAISEPFNLLLFVSPHSIWFEEKLTWIIETFAPNRTWSDLLAPTHCITSCSDNWFTLWTTFWLPVSFRQSWAWKHPQRLLMRVNAYSQNVAPLKREIQKRRLIHKVRLGYRGVHVHDGLQPDNAILCNLV